MKKKHELLPPDSDSAEPTVLLTTDLAAMGVPGVLIEFDPDQAEEMGAFEEDALSAEDALDSMFDEPLGSEKES